jgi:Flp pilus assembly protein TadD
MSRLRHALIFLLLVCGSPLFAEEKPAEDTPAYPPEVTDALVKGNEAFKKGDFKNAKKHFARMLELLPDHPAALANLASAEYRLENLAEAETLQRRAARAQPESAHHWITLGIICLEQKKVYDAISAFAQAVALQPDSARAHGYLGVTFGRQEWFAAAEKELRKALELDPDYADAHFNLALTYLNRRPPSVELARRHYYAALDLGAQPDPAVEKRLARQSE